MPYYASSLVVNDENLYPFPATTGYQSRRSGSRRSSSHDIALDTVGDHVKQCSAVSFPRHLRRPAFRRIFPSSIKTVAPELGNVAVEYIQHKIAEVGSSMYYNACKAVAKCPPGRLPRELQVILNDIAAPPPTHVFAVYSNAAKQRINLYPVHALVIASTCAHLPSLPYSKPDTPKYRGVSVVLPVVPVALQTPESFPALLEYLYTMDTDALLRTILPVPRQGAIPPPDLIARELKASYSPSALLTYQQRIYGLWTTVTALGVFDEKLWRTMEAAWEVLHIAMM